MDKRTCKEGDGNPVLALGWCSRCYQAARMHNGDPHAGGPRKTGRVRGKCKIEWCPEPRAGQGWCSKHYGNFRRHGDPEWISDSPHRAYSLDDRFFDVIDTEAKAYWLGFITADGCVRSGPQGAAGWNLSQVNVKLKASDAGHLEKLKADLGAESPLIPVPHKTHPGVQVSFSSRPLVDALIRLGVTPRKSLTVEPWNGPDDLMRHYWRGLVDGDGTIVRHPGEREKWHVRLIGSEAVVEAFRIWASAVSGSTANKYPKVNIWSWTAGGLASPQALARELYGDATVYLDRKYELAGRLIAAPVLHRSKTTSWRETAAA